MNTRLILSTVTLVFAGVAFGAAHAGTTAGNSPAAKAETTTSHVMPLTRTSAHRKHHAAHAAHIAAMGTVSISGW